MATMWRKAALWLGLGPDDEYDDEGGDARPLDSASRPAPPEPPMARTGAVRALPREPSNADASGEPAPPASPPVTASAPRARAGVVRQITAHPHASAKPHAVSPVSFNEAQEVADKFMAGTPVIVNLQGVNKDLSRRFVDFASGLCYGLRGQMERVTTQVYLLTPSNVEVSAEERRRLQERG